MAGMVRVSRDGLLAALRAALRGAARRGSAVLPGEEMLLVEALEEEQAIAVTGTDLEAWVRAVEGARVDGSWALAAPREIVDWVRALPAGGVVQMEALEGERLRARAGETIEGVFAGVSVDGFPPIGDRNGDGGMTVGVDGAAFARLAALQRVAARDGSRPALETVLLRLVGGELVGAASDGFRVAEARVSAEGTAFEVMVPRRVMAEVERALGDGEDVEVRVRVCEAPRQVIFQIGERLEIGALTMVGQFPAYAGAVPEAFTGAATVSREMLQAALAQVMVFGEKKVRHVRIEGVEGQLVVAARHSEVGEGRVVLPAEVEGEVRIAANGVFLREGVSLVEGRLVMLEVSGQASAFRVRGVGDEAFWYLQMPLI